MFYRRTSTLQSVLFSLRNDQDKTRTRVQEASQPTINIRANLLILIIYGVSSLALDYYISFPSANFSIIEFQAGNSFCHQIQYTVQTVQYLVL